MQYIIGLITAFAGLLWALNSLQRSGVSLNLNPFAWYRRSQWKKTYGAKPLYKLSDPIDAAAVLLLGTAKCRGELTQEQREKIKTIFVEHFKLPANEADDLMVAASFLTRDEVYIGDSLNKILKQTRTLFSTEQKASLLNLMDEVANIGGPPNQEQKKLVEGTLAVFNQRP